MIVGRGLSGTELQEAPKWNSFKFRFMQMPWIVIMAYGEIFMRQIFTMEVWRLLLTTSNASMIRVFKHTHTRARVHTRTEMRAWQLLLFYTWLWVV